jgi:hypothetical protein
MVAQLGLRAVECQTHSEGWTSIDPTEEQMALRKKDIIRQVDEAFTGSQVHRFTGSRVHGFTGSQVQRFTGSRVRWFEGRRFEVRTKPGTVSRGTVNPKNPRTRETVYR